MALSNHERVGKALDLLKEGLRPFVERELKAQHAQLWFEQAKASVSDSQANLFGTEAEPRWDVAALLSVMWNQWQLVFRKTLGQTERTLVSELREVLLITGFAPTRLRMELDRIPLWRGDHVPVKQLVEDFARYLYLPRLKDVSVLLGAVRDGLSLLTWEQEAFAYADSYDEAAER